ncbi:MAG: RNA polymerase sigma factor SigF [Candidatus Nanopelagicales bacterium]
MTGTDGKSSSPGSRGWTQEDRKREHALLARLAQLDDDDPARGALRDEIVTMHLPLVHHLARRFRDRGEPHDDLVQVGTIGLIKSVDRFDTERGVEFSTYATPTILGEIKRHFRDKGWSVRVPRRLQELRMTISRATSELSQSQGRSPTVKELAAHLRMSEEEVLEGLESAQAYSTLSLDASGSDPDADAPALVDSLGDHDSGLETVEYRETLRPLLASLPERERQIIMLRFFHNKTQSDIADEVGVSQMHVSRLLAKSLGTLRNAMGVDA